MIPLTGPLKYAQLNNILLGDTVIWIWLILKGKQRNDEFRKT